MYWLTFYSLTLFFRTKWITIFQTQKKGTLFGCNDMTKKIRSIKNNFSSLPFAIHSKGNIILGCIEVIVFQSNFNFLKSTPTLFSHPFDDAHRTSNFGWWWQQIIFFSSSSFIRFFVKDFFYVAQRVEGDYNSVAVAHMMEDWKCNYGTRNERILIILGCEKKIIKKLKAGCHNWKTKMKMLRWGKISVHHLLIAFSCKRWYEKNFIKANF